MAMAIRNRLFIDNEWRDGAEGRVFETFDPATEEPIAAVAVAEPEDVARAVDAAERAMKGEWGRMAPERRGELLERLAGLIDARREEIAALETLDMGKPLRESLANVARSSRTCRYYAGAVDKHLGQSVPVGHNAASFTVHEPLGATAHITPWNYPFANACRSLPAALAAGCTVVLKPASDTPLTTLLLGELCAEAGFPAGVVNVLTGGGGSVGAALASHPGIRGITFTGSVSTGRRIAAMAAERVVPTVLELGGKNPLILFADADLDNAVTQTLRGAYTNAGQVCTSVSRVLVERRIHANFVEALAARVRGLTIGNGRDNPDIGPLVSRAHYDTVAGHVRVARERDGARLVAGGARAEGQPRGWFWQPTLFDAVTPDMSLAREEIFGPVLAVIAFDDEAEALGIANGLSLGLTSGIFTRDIQRAFRFARDLQAGMVWINEWFLSPVQTPHGGVKESGIGREQGLAALANYTQSKTIGIRY
ncbi:MAG: aldehyde dehydrogenase [Alphaproteobacteria bacterium]|nr:aldehyde dehydrogenase [Alphaproteobacteria bacterium]